MSPRGFATVASLAPIRCSIQRDSPDETHLCQPWRMNTNRTFHTPFEVLVFFQSLRSLGVDATSFSRTSELLRRNEFIRNDEAFDEDRLSPESLKQLYLALLKEEVQNEQRRQNKAPPGGSQANPRKRKLSSPPLSTLDESAQHQHLIPHLVNRLYARYRDHAVHVVQEEQRRYRALSQNIQEIERGEWDSRLKAAEESARREPSSGLPSGVPSIQNLLQQGGNDVAKGLPKIRSNEDFGASGHPPPRDGTAATTNGTAHERSKKPATPVSAEVKVPPPDDIRSPTSSGRQPSMPRTADASTRLPHDAHQPPAPGFPQPSSQTPILPPISFPMASPKGELPRQLPRPPAVTTAPPIANPLQRQQPIPPNDKSPASPIILPPPPGMLQSSASPEVPRPFDPSTLPSNPYRTAENKFSPHQKQLPPDRQISASSSRSHNQSPFPYPGNHPPNHQSYVPYAQPYAPSPAQPGSNLGYSPNLGNANHVPNQLRPLSFHNFQTHAPSPNAVRGQATPQNAATSVAKPSAPVTPLLSAGRPRKSYGLSRIDTSVSSTRWKSDPHATPKESQKSPVRPDRSPYLPSSPSPSPEPEVSECEGRPTQRKRGRFTKGVARSVETPTRGSGRRGRWGAYSSRGRGGRAMSSASSRYADSAVPRTRSQSIASPSVELGHEAKGTGRRIKQEPPATPAAITDDNESAVSATADTSLRSSRLRRDTLRGLDAPRNLAGAKRKRADTTTDPALPMPASPDPPALGPTVPALPTRPNHVLASRNFPRVVAPLMNDINSHKLASLFAKPITERDAPGYHALIHRPQDLKSIRGAISAGSRAVAAAAAATEAPHAGAADDTHAASPPPLAPSSSAAAKAATLWVERGPDVEPPRGIVNSAQLEKEICRMFANAVMFNPDPQRGFGPVFAARGGAAAAAAGPGARKGAHADVEGGSGAGIVENDEGAAFVKDAREMFEGVERSVAAWRAAERATEDRGGPGAGEEGGD